MTNEMTIEQWLDLYTWSPAREWRELQLRSPWQPKQIGEHHCETCQCPEIEAASR